MAYCLNWRDCKMCDSDKRNDHLTGYEVRPEDVFYERKWEPLKRNVDENSLGPERTAQHAEESKKEQGDENTTRRRRATYKRWQVDVLEEAFEVNCYPSTIMKKILAARLNIENIQVQVWFQNRRARMKKDGPSQSLSPYTRSYPPISLHTRYYPQTSPYSRYTPSHLPYSTEVLTSINRRHSSCEHVQRYPVVSPMFSRWELDRVLYQHHPRHAFSSPTMMTSSANQRTMTSSPNQRAMTSSPSQINDVAADI